MKRHCQRCRTRLRAREMRCPYCREPALNWLHYIALAAIALPAILYLLNRF